MRSAKSTGRIVGVLLLLHLITGLMAPYIMLRPLATSQNFTENNLINSFQVRLSIMMLFVGGAMTIAIAVTTLPVFRQYSYAMALWLLALAIANFSLQGVENAAWMSMFTLSRDYPSETIANVGAYQLVGAAVRAGWKWVHYTHLLIVVSWMWLLCAILWRSALVPRALAAVGLITPLLQIGGITLPQFLAYRSPAPMLMGMTLGVSYLALSVWLMVKGFRASTEEGNR